MFSSTAMIDKICAGGFESGSAPTDSESGRRAECIGLVAAALAGSGGGGASISPIESFIDVTEC
jgi:hypothetical protein